MIKNINRNVQFLGLLVGILSILPIISRADDCGYEEDPNFISILQIVSSAQNRSGVVKLPLPLSALDDYIDSDNPILNDSRFVAIGHFGEKIKTTSEVKLVRQFAMPQGDIVPMGLNNNNVLVTNGYYPSLKNDCYRHTSQDCRFLRLDGNTGEQAELALEKAANCEYLRPAINDAGVIVARYTEGDGALSKVSRVVRFEADGSSRRITLPPEWNDVSDKIFAVNETGQFVGSYSTGYYNRDGIFVIDNDEVIADYPLVGDIELLGVMSGNRALLNVDDKLLQIMELATGERITINKLPSNRQYYYNIVPNSSGQIFSMKRRVEHGSNELARFSENNDETSVSCLFPARADLGIENIIAVNGAGDILINFSDSRGASRPAVILASTYLNRKRNYCAELRVKMVGECARYFKKHYDEGEMELRQDVDYPSGYTAQCTMDFKLSIGGRPLSNKVLNLQDTHARTGHEIVASARTNRRGRGQIRYRMRAYLDAPVYNLNFAGDRRLHNTSALIRLIEDPGGTN